MIFSIFKYTLKALLSFAGEVFVWLFAWFIALFYYKQEESRVTGYPSQFPGRLREHIDFPFTWASTFDDCADAMFYSGRMPDVTKSQYDSSKWIRYKARVLWLWRNPAYTLSRDLGFDQTDLQIEEIKNEEHLWDKGYPNTSYWKFSNAYGEKGFLYQKQIHLFNQFFFEMVLGYKVPWANEKKNRAMIAHRFTIKRYLKQKL